jgi:hypothetical protein
MMATAGFRPLVATAFPHPVESLDAADFLVRDLTGVKAETADGEIALRLTPFAECL